MKKSLILTLVVVTIAQITSAKETGVPLVGILAQPGINSFKHIYNNPPHTTLYTPTSYVRYVEQAGAIAVIIPYNIAHDEFEAIIRNLDAFLFPGGGTLVLDSQGKKTLYQLRTE